MNSLTVFEYQAIEITHQKPYLNRNSWTFSIRAHPIDQFFSIRSTGNINFRLLAFTFAYGRLQPVNRFFISSFMWFPNMAVPNCSKQLLFWNFGDTLNNFTPCLQNHFGLFSWTKSKLYSPRFPSNNLLSNPSKSKAVSNLLVVWPLLTCQRGWLPFAIFRLLALTSLTKCRLTSMCFLLSWNTMFFENMNRALRIIHNHLILFKPKFRHKSLQPIPFLDCLSRRNVLDFRCR